MQSGEGGNIWQSSSSVPCQQRPSPEPLTQPCLLPIADATGLGTGSLWARGLGGPHGGWRGSLTVFGLCSSLCPSSRTWVTAPGLSLVPSFSAVPGPRAELHAEGLSHKDVLNEKTVPIRHA